MLSQDKSDDDLKIMNTIRKMQCKDDGPNKNKCVCEKWLNSILCISKFLEVFLLWFVVAFLEILANV